MPQFDFSQALPQIIWLVLVFGILYLAAALGLRALDGAGPRLRAEGLPARLLALQRRQPLVPEP